MMSASLTASLKMVGAVMIDAQFPWWIITSAAVALHGADPGHVADIDVLLSTKDATRILPSIGVRVARGSAHPDFRSTIFGRWNDTPIPVEFMAGFCHRSGTDWVLVEPASRHLVELDGVVLYIPSRMDLQRLLESFARPKDIERARRLDALR